MYDGLQTSAVESSTLAAADGVHDDDLNAMVQDDASVAGEKFDIDLFSVALPVLS